MLVKITKLVRVGNEAKESEEFIFNLNSMVRAFNARWIEEGFDVHCIKVVCVDGSSFYMSYRAAYNMFRYIEAPQSICNWASQYFGKADVELE